MDVKIYAFSLAFRHGISIDDLFEHTNKDGKVKSDKLLNYLRVRTGPRPKIEAILTSTPSTTNPDYIIGLSLNIKDISAFCSVTASNGALNISAEILARDTLMTDFNFFVINRSTGRGLYQHYFQSPQTTTFCGRLKKNYTELRKILMEAEILRLQQEENRPEKRAWTLAAKKYFRFLDYSVITRPESFEELISELRQLRSLTIVPETYKKFNKFGKSSNGLLKKVTQKILFERDTETIEDVKDFAVSLFKREKFSSATAVGMDINGKEATIKLKNDYQVLHSYKYDDFIMKISLNDFTTSLNDSEVISDLLRLTQRPRIKNILETSLE